MFLRYPASVDSVVGDGENHIKVKYSDSSKEDISIDSHCFYFIQDKVDRVSLRSFFGGKNCFELL